WVIAVVFAVILLWRKHGDPVVDIFVGAWLLAWALVPAYFLRGLLAGRQGRSLALTTRPTGFDRWGARIFVGCWAVGFLAGMPGMVRQGDAAELVRGLSFFAAFILFFVVVELLRRQTVSIDAFALETRNSFGPLCRTRRYQLRLISAPRTVEKKDG